MMLAGFANFEGNAPPPTRAEQVITSVGQTLACAGVPLTLGVLVAWLGLVGDMRGTIRRAIERGGAEDGPAPLAP
jgi:hypothetical protein